MNAKMRAKLQARARKPRYYPSTYDWDADSRPCNFCGVPINEHDLLPIHPGSKHAWSLRYQIGKRKRIPDAWDYLQWVIVAAFFIAFFITVASGGPSP